MIVWVLQGQHGLTFDFVKDVPKCLVDDSSGQPARVSGRARYLYDSMFGTPIVECDAANQFALEGHPECLAVAKASAPFNVPGNPEGNPPIEKGCRYIP
ncbi:MAG: hypothetical protein AAFX90_12585 [Pseudomonadota bacterium]